ncbi:MAG: GtrA family protein [Pseudomonadota bacterium]
MANTHFRGAVLFATVGVFNALTDVGVFAFLHLTLGLGAVLSNTIAFLASNIQSYLLNSAITFRDENGRQPLSLRRYLKFAALHIFGFGVATAVLVLLKPYIGPIGAKLVSLVFVFVTNYTLSAIFVFRKPAAEKA